MGTGLGAIVLTRLLEIVQQFIWGGDGVDLLSAVVHSSALWRTLALLGAGLTTGLGQLLLGYLASGNAIDITAAIWFTAGRMPAWRTMGSAVLSVILVGMGISLGREGAPKQAGAVLANLLSDHGKLSDEQRRLLVACGAGAGMSAAYGVPLGGALFALEVLRGVFALRLVLPALLCSLIAAAVAWTVLPNRLTYSFPVYDSSLGVDLCAIGVGLVAGVVAVGYVRAVAWAERHKPKNLRRFIAPILVLGSLGIASIKFPELLGNGKDLVQQTFLGQVNPSLLIALLVLKPVFTVLCINAGAPGGLFTPSLTLGALLGAALGAGWSTFWPGTPLGLFAVVGAGAIVAATTQGPISAVVLLIELTGHDRSIVVPLLMAVIVATLVSRTIEPRSIYDARLTDEQVQARLKVRDATPAEGIALAGANG